MQRIVTNLLSNAVKFTERGQVVVRVTSTPMSRDRCELQLSVRDSGIGIPEESLDRVFLAFYQVDDSLTRRHGGVGLGLAISRRLVELMQGARPLVERRPGMTDVELVIEEILQDKIAIDYEASGLEPPETQEE